MINLGYRGQRITTTLGKQGEMLVVPMWRTMYRAGASFSLLPNRALIPRQRAEARATVESTI